MTNQNQGQPPPKKPDQKPRFPAIHLAVRVVAMVITLLLVVGAVMLVAYRDELNMDALNRYITYLRLESTEAGTLTPFIHAGGQSMDFVRLDTGVVMVSQSGAHYYGPTGDSYAQQVGALAVPVLTRSDTTAVTYDAGGQSLHLFTDYANPFSLTLDESEELLSARPNDQGWLAVTAQKSGYKGAVTIYDDSYNTVMEINLSSSFVVDAALSPDCTTVAVVTIGQVDGVFQSNLLLYPTDGKDPTVTLSLEGTVVLDMEYESDQLFILSDHSVIILSPDGTVLTSYSYDPYHLKGYTLGGDGFVGLLLSEYQAGDPTLLITLGGDGLQMGSYDLKGEVPDMDSDGQYLSILSSEGLLIFRPDLTLYAQLEDTQGAQAVAQSSDGSVLLAAAQEAWIYLPF